LKCECGKEYRQVNYDGDLPKFCQDCGAKLNGENEDYLDIDVNHDSHSDLKFIFVTGRVKRKTVDFRFDSKTLDICKFSENEVDLTELAFLKTFLKHYAEGKIKIFGKTIR
jgi:hypothetical protein